MINRELFVKFLRVFLFQPGTAFWQAVAHKQQKGG
jgi:hypothetical protein